MSSLFDVVREAIYKNIGEPIMEDDFDDATRAVIKAMPNYVVDTTCV